MIPIFESINWPVGMAPSLCPIHFTNELETSASPEVIWHLLTNTREWPKFYPNISHVELLHGHETLQMGTAFETSFAGQDVSASVQEFEPYSRIAWGGFPKIATHSRAYHAWIITPTDRGCHLWTEETMQGDYWIELAKKAPDGFWLAHERLLADLARIAEGLQSARSQAQ